MDVTALREAYAAFLEAAESGPFVPPVSSWPAELVVAHVSANDRLIAVHIAEALAGEHPSYDNRPATREPSLRWIVTRMGGMDGVVREARRTSERVLTLAEQVDGDLLGRPFPVYILDGETVQVDQPVPIPGLIGAQVKVHIPAHTDELRRLSAQRVSAALAALTRARRNPRRSPRSSIRSRPR